MKLNRSIRFSLTLWYTVTLLVVMLLFSSVVYVTIRADIYKETDRGLLSIAESLASPTMEPFRKAAPSVFDQVLEDFFGPKISDKYVQLLEPNGNVSAASKNLNNTRLPLSRKAQKKTSAGSISQETVSISGLPLIRMITMPVYSDRHLARIVQVGTSLNDQYETLRKFEIIFAVSIPLGVLVLCGGGWFLAGRALKPVDEITRSAQRITAENLSQRLVVVNPNDEIGRLAETFNSTLSRLEASFIRTKRFFADISHELRTPLTIIRGEAEVGMKWAKDPEEFREIMTSTLDEANRMSAIVESLLELSRAEEGGLHLESHEIDIPQFLSGLAKEFQQQSRITEQNKKVVITHSSQVCVLGDQRRLRQVFLNLLDNALKYTPEGGTVRVGISGANNVVMISVSDDGPGIPPEDIPHIFERFYRVDKSRNRGDGGSGLGLSLVKSLLEAHGGTVSVTSTVGKGSVFTVTLPATECSQLDTDRHS